MSLPFDATLKEIVRQAPTDFLEAFHLPAQKPVQSLNVDLSTLSATTDVAPDPLKEIVDLNFQSGPDAEIDARLHLYNAVFHRKYSVPVRSILVLLRPKADDRRLTGKLAYSSRNQRTSFHYEVVRLTLRPFV